MDLMNLGLIGNCQVSALTDSRGGIVWLCLPQPDSPSVFGELLDPDGGSFKISPGNSCSFNSSSEYLVNTNVLRTVFKDDLGSFELIDFCPRFYNSDRTFRPTQIFRIVRPLSGSPMIQASITPKWNYGRGHGSTTLGSNHIQFSHEKESLRLTTTVPLSYINESHPFRLSKPAYFILAYGSPFEAEIASTAESFLLRTMDYWRRWVRQCSIPSLYGEEVIRSALCLKLHTYNDTGAILAATTTSIPEFPGTGRTWDYRFCWLRDASFQIDTLMALGHTEEVEGFVEYLANLIETNRNHRLSPVYRISGSPLMGEEILSHWKGFQGEGPVRIGNQAMEHIQNDIYGEMILSIAPLFFDARFADRDNKPLFEHIHWLAQKCLDTLKASDAGLWEFRHEQRRHLFTVFTLIAGLRRASEIALLVGKKDLANEWHKASNTLHQEAIKTLTDGPYVIPQSLDGPFIADASSLMAPLFGFVSPKDPLFLKTLSWIEGKLMTLSGLKRYEGDDGMGIMHTCFGLCTFWYIEALALAGKKKKAREWFEKILQFRNPLGLLSEDWTPGEGKLWGNFPQVYSHVGIIRCAMRLSPHQTL